MARANTTQQKAATNTTSTTSTTAANYCQQFEQDLAKRLGVSVDKLTQAALASGQDTLAQMVKDGNLTQAQADQIKQHFSSGQICDALNLAGDKGVGPGHFGGPTLQKYLSSITTQIAQGLHLTSAQLTTQLESGKSLSDIATAQKIDATQLQSIVTNAIQKTLKEAVTAGDLTQAQADALQQQLKNNPSILQHILDRHFDQNNGDKGF
jgi:polyhydroxyalkanoate synthesis regulator phasin